MFAAQQGDADTARILLRAGAKVRMKLMPKTGLTPLIIASAMGQVKAVDALLEGGANPNLVDANGFTALHRAVRDSDYRNGPSDKTRSGNRQVASSHRADPNVRSSGQRKGC